MMECFFNPAVSCEVFNQYGNYIWLGIGIFLSLIELLIPGVFVVFFGIGAISVGIILSIFPIPFIAQILIWLVISVGGILLGAKFLHRLFPAQATKDPSNYKIYENKITLVIKDIKPNKKHGRIQFQGTEWDASSNEEILVGEYAKILHRDNISFSVTKASSEEVENFLASKRKFEEEE